MSSVRVCVFYSPLRALKAWKESMPCMSTATLSKSSSCRVTLHEQACRKMKTRHTHTLILTQVTNLHAESPGISPDDPWLHTPPHPRHRGNRWCCEHDLYRQHHHREHNPSTLLNLHHPIAGFHYFLSLCHITLEKQRVKLENKYRGWRKAAAHSPPLCQMDNQIFDTCIWTWPMQSSCKALLAPGWGRSSRRRRQSLPSAGQPRYCTRCTEAVGEGRFKIGVRWS